MHGMQKQMLRYAGPLYKTAQWHYMQNKPRIHALCASQNQFKAQFHTTRKNCFMLELMAGMLVVNGIERGIVHGKEALQNRKAEEKALGDKERGILNTINQTVHKYSFVDGKQTTIDNGVRKVIQSAQLLQYDDCKFSFLQSRGRERIDRYNNLMWAFNRLYNNAVARHDLQDNTLNIDIEHPTIAYAELITENMTPRLAGKMPSAWFDSLRKVQFIEEEGLGETSPYYSNWWRSFPYRAHEARVNLTRGYYDIANHILSTSDLSVVPSSLAEMWRTYIHIVRHVDDEEWQKEFVRKLVTHNVPCAYWPTNDITNVKDGFKALCNLSQNTTYECIPDMLTDNSILLNGIATPASLHEREYFQKSARGFLDHTSLPTSFSSGTFFISSLNINEHPVSPDMLTTRANDCE